MLEIIYLEVMKMKKFLILLATILVFGTIACTAKNENITADQALSAVKNYCYKNNPDLEEMIKSNNYTINWEIQSSDDKEIVILYRSYTSALVRYYIDPVTGDTYVTEFMPGITESEQKTDEHFNIKDYLSK